ncbi:hypothetical protein ACFLX8_03045 [Chloroflexota bacterium]
MTISSTPVTNSGSEIPTRLAALTNWSPTELLRTPAHTPVATAAGTETKKANVARITELNSLDFTTSTTGRL